MQARRDPMSNGGYHTTPKIVHGNARGMHPTSRVRTRVLLISLILAALVGLMFYSDYRGHRLLEAPTSAGAKLQQSEPTD